MAPFFFQWKLASLLHDVGYAIEILNRLDNRMYEYFEKSLLGRKEYEYTPHGCEKLREYYMMYSGEGQYNLEMLDLFSKRINDWGYEINANAIFNDMCEGNQIDNSYLRADHGVISSIFVVKAIDYKYEKNNPNQTIDPYNVWNYDNILCEIVNVGSSIFLHNMNRDDFYWDFKTMPIATLLKICDELQDWERPDDNNHAGNSPDDYNIEFHDGSIVFFVVEDKIEKIHAKFEKIRNFPIEFRVLEKVIEEVQ